MADLSGINKASCSKSHSPPNANIAYPRYLTKSAKGLCLLEIFQIHVISSEQIARKFYLNQLDYLSDLQLLIRYDKLNKWIKYIIR